MRGNRYALLAVLALTMSTSGCSYNKLQKLDEQINQAKGQINTQLQRRADLIGNLVETVKGVTKQEDTVFISIANARARIGAAAQSGDVQAMAEANAAMNAPLSRLLAITEAYPTLRSAENFRALQDQLEGTENRIAAARSDYNAAVGTFNATIRTFPTNLTAKMFKLGKPRPYFQADSGAAVVPKVKFGG